MSESVLYNFTVDSGINPQTLVQYGSTAYGIAQNGGANGLAFGGYGTIFSISLNSPNTFNKLYDFSSNTLLGINPISIVINSAGTTIYGLTVGGGVSGGGALFSFLTSPPYTYSKLYDFSNNGISGSYPYKLVISGSTLYGYTINGSTNLTGALFSITTSGTSFSRLYSTQYVSFYNNQIVSLAVSGSTLYFSTNYDSTLYGTIYSIPVTGGAATTLRTDLSANAVPYNLTVSGSTIYFSTQTATPGSPITYANWQICSISTTGTGFQQLISRTTTQNEGLGSMILSGNTFYGASLIGGDANFGGLYSAPISISSSATRLYSFLGQPTDGYGPLVNIFYNLNLYGVTLAGGTSNLGTIFSYGPKQYNFLPVGSTITDRYNISTNGTCKIGDNSNNLLSGTLASPPGKTNTYTLAVKGNINCVGATTDVSGASTGTYYSNSVTSFRIAADSSANRPPIPLKGYIRYNTDVNFLEFWNGTQWYYLSFLTSVPNTATGTGYTALYTDLNNLNPTTSGPYENGYTVFKYLGPSGTFVPNFTGFVQLLLVGGGGGGGRTGGGGGGGAVVNTYAYVVATSSYTITVGQGGAGATADGVLGVNGTSSIFTTLSGNVNISAIGGGGGGSYGINGGNGGSGGGAGATDAGYAYGGTGLINGSGGTNYNGGGGGAIGTTVFTSRIAGGGGGAGAAGSSGTTSVGGNGGNGIISNISGTSTYYAGGGGGIAQASGFGGSQTPGTGGLGGGGNAAASGGVAGSVNTGGGGGGFVGGVTGGTAAGGQGGSGIVFVQFPSYSVFTLTPNIPSVSGTIQMNLSFVTVANEPSIYPVAGGYTIATITSASSASITFSNSSSLNLYFLAVGGGGGGGSNLGNISGNILNGDGGGGGGSVITNFNPPYSAGAALSVSSSLPITAITIGAGGNPGTSATAMTSSSGASWGPGGNTTFTCNGTTYLAYGGGGGGSFDGDTNTYSPGQRSGFGASSSLPQPTSTTIGVGSGGGVKQGGVVPTIGGTASPAAGSIYNTYAGSAGNSNVTGGGSGGGGASGTITSTPTTAAGTAGANGIYSTIINSTGDYYGSGGGGGAQASQNATGGSGGTGGGGQGCGSSSANKGFTLLGLQGASNKGGGGGGGGGSDNYSAGSIGSSVGGSGGSGVLIFRFSSFG